MRAEMIYPERIFPGDKIGIISPATAVKPEYIDGLCRELAHLGYLPVVMPHAKGPASGSYASSLENRMDDFLAAWTEPEIKGIICARGGYGTAQLLPHIPPEIVRDNAKWLVGFSDISALHAFLFSHGVASIHGPMAKHFTELGTSHYCAAAVLRIMSGLKHVSYELSGNELNSAGCCTGELRGGNLAVLNGLTATPYDIFNIKDGEDVILFLEDIAEPIYKIDRVLWRLYMSGTLQRLRGLIIGQFTEYNSDKNFSNVEELISTRLSEWNIRIPVTYGFPVGHVDRNLPMVQGARCRLEIKTSNVSFEMEIKQ